MIVDGLALAALTGIGFYFLFTKLPRSVKRFLRKHILLTDAVACALTYLLFGQTLVALFAAAWLGIIVSAILSITKNKSANKALEGVLNTAALYWKKFETWLAQKFPADQEEEEETNA